MGGDLATPGFVKYRREEDFGLVYTHENYGDEDASLYETDERVVDVLQRAEGGAPRTELKREFGADVVEELRSMELLVDAG